MSHTDNSSIEGQWERFKNVQRDSGSNPITEVQFIKNICAALMDEAVRIPDPSETWSADFEKGYSVARRWTQENQDRIKSRFDLP